jgi:5'-nucleotidase/UDP-sugar diphosphatase
MKPLARLAPLWGAALALGGCTVETTQLSTADQDIRLTLFHTTDWHSRILPYAVVEVGLNDRNQNLLQENSPFGGAARLATLLKCARVKDLSKIPPVCCCLEPSKCPGFSRVNSPVCCTRKDGSCEGCAERGTCASPDEVELKNHFEGLVGSERFAYLDSGDYFQGAPIFNAFAGEVETRVMSQLKPDAVTVGNHEFDKGLENFADQSLRWANFPLLAANYAWDGSRYRGAQVLKDLVKPYVVLNLDGVRVGVIGMGNFSSMLGIFRGDNNLGITPLNPYQILQDFIDFLKPQVEIVVALSHMGLRGEDNFNPEDEELIQNTTGLDLVLGGHLHVLLKPPKVVLDCVTPRCQRFGSVAPRRVLLMHTSAFLKFAGRLDLVVRNKEIVSFKQYVFPIDRRIPEDGIMNELLEPYVLELSRRFDLTRVYAYDLTQLERFDSSGGDSQLGNLVCEAMRTRRRVETDFCMTNSLGIRDVFPKGPVTFEQFFNVFPFENTIATMLLSGTEVQELFDYITFRSAERGCQSQAQISNATFVMNCARIRAERITIGGSKAGCFEDDDCLFPNAETGAPGGEICTNAVKYCADGEDCCPHKERSCRTCGRPIEPSTSYSLATNDYVAKGGSGFLVLERNTTQVDTLIPMRTAVIDFLGKQPTCAERPDTCAEGINAGYPNVPCINGQDPTIPWARHDGRITRITSE